MDKEKFRQLYETARKAAQVKGDDLSERSRARRQLRQTLDVLSIQCEARQWQSVEWARQNDFPEFEALKKRYPDL